MAINDSKILSWTSPVSAEVDQPVRAASAMKAVFDSNSNQLKTALNAVIDTLAGSGGSAEIGSAAISDVDAGTLLSQLTALRALIDQRVKNIAVGTVATGAAGSSAEVNVSGTMPEVVLNFTIPKGDTGDPTTAHAFSHASGGTDAVSPASIGAAAGDHDHDGTYAPVTSGTSILKGDGSGGFLSASGETDYVAPPAAVSGSGSITVTVEDNKKYVYTAVTSLTMTGAAVNCTAKITFTASTPTIDVTNFTESKGDSIDDAAASETWELNCEDGLAIWTNWGCCRDMA